MTKKRKSSKRKPAKPRAASAKAGKRPKPAQKSARAAAARARGFSRARANDMDSTALLPRNLEVDYRLDQVEQLIVMHGPRRASKQCQPLFGVKRRAADKYVRAVFKMWAIEARADRESKRAQLRAMLMNNYRQAHAQLKPDIRAANEAVELLGRFDGLIEPDNKGNKLPETSEQVEKAMLEHYGMESLQPGQTVVMEQATADGEA